MSFMKFKFVNLFWLKALQFIFALQKYNAFMKQNFL